MDLIDSCKTRQVELQSVLDAIEDGSLSNADDILMARLRRNAQSAITLYEKMIHLLNDEQIGHS